MKILVLIHEFPPVGGGGGRAAQEICRGLARRGHRITVLTAHLPGLPRRETADGLEVVRLPSLRREAFRAGLLPMGAYLLVGLAAGLPLIRRWKPDLIHGHFAVPAGALAWMLARLTGLSYVLTAHLGDVPGGVPEKTGRWFRWLLPFTPPIWRGARRVVAVSEYTRSLAQQHYPVPIEVVPNGVDLEAASASPEEPGTPPRLVFAGRFVPQKDPLQIVRTLVELRDLAWQAVLIGDGPLRGEVERQIQEHGLEDRILLTGWLTPEQVTDWFSRSDILFMPSLSEGLPVVGVQALASGLAIVASRIGGFVDVVEDGRNGFLVDRAHPSEFAAGLRLLLSDSARLRGCKRASREKAAVFDLRRVVERYETIFREVLDER
ncbi:MAG: glycosyltransferase family 4 protein [Anaerolineales bacterium]